MKREYLTETFHVRRWEELGGALVDWGKEGWLVVTIIDVTKKNEVETYKVLLVRDY